MVIINRVGKLLASILCIFILVAVWHPSTAFSQLEQQTIHLEIFAKGHKEEKQFFDVVENLSSKHPKNKLAVDAKSGAVKGVYAFILFQDGSESKIKVEIGKSLTKIIL